MASDTRSTRVESFTEFTTLRDRLMVGQRTFAKVAYNGLEPCDLEGEEALRSASIWGSVARFDPASRRVVVMVKGRDVGGTRLGAERLVHLGATISLDRHDPDEVVFCFFGGPKIRHARVGLRFARTAALRKGLRIESDTADGFTMIRHDGRKVRFEAFAASRGGDNVRGVPIVGALLTEAAFYLDESTGVSNGEAIFAAIIPRLLDGGQIIIESTVWAESGLLFTEFDRNYGHPTTAIAAFCPTLVMRDDAVTIAMVARERERDTENATREFDAAFMPLGSGYYFDHFALKQCIDESLPLVMTMGPGWAVVGTLDPAYARDACEGFIIGVKGGIFYVGEGFTRIPVKGTPLVPSVVDGEFADVMVRHGATRLATDIHYRESVKEHVKKRGIVLVDVPANNAGKNETHALARELINSGRVKWSAGHRRLTQQMREVVSKPLPGGLVSISSPRRKGNHGDAASALCLGLWAAAKWSKDVLLTEAEQRHATVERRANARKLEEYLGVRLPPHDNDRDPMEEALETLNAQKAAR